MRMTWALALGLASLVAVQGCKRKEPIPGPKAGLAMVTVYGDTGRASSHTPAIAWFQGSLDEGFARAAMPQNCREYGVGVKRTTELSRVRKKLSLPSPEAPPIIRPRHRLV